MPKTIIGLDIGSHSIKAARLQGSIRSFEIDAFYEKIIPRESEYPSEEVIIDTLREMVSEGEMGGYTFITSLPGNRLFARIISLPFTDEKKIEQVVDFEVEGDLPFPLEELVVDYHILQKKEKESRILVSAVEKEFFKNYLSVLATAGIDPRIVDIDSLALFNLSQIITAGNDKEKCLSIIDFGASKTSICIFNNGQVFFVRTIPLAGDSITREVQKDFGLSFAQAEEIKLHNGELSQDEKERLSMIIRKVVGQLLQEISQTFYHFGEMNIKRVDEVFICGGTSNLLNLPEYLTEKLGIEVKKLKVVKEIPNSLTRTSELDSISPQSIALALREVSRANVSQINFRKGEFSFRKAIKEIQGSLIFTGVMAFVILFLASFSFFSRYYQTNSQYQELQKETNAIFAETFPGEVKIVDPVRQMQSKIEEMERKIGYSSENAEPILDFLQEICERIPNEIKIDVEDLLIDFEQIRMKGKTESIEAVDIIKNELSKNERFKKVEVKDTRRGIDESIFNFQINISLVEEKP
ncbi:MAG: type IV pilus assembly protein PilM [Deltaproteobacteria bacterium]|nr:MAG: type IV pilus assembly protein PilM [Deltaproteobacteria bacterium]